MRADPAQAQKLALGVERQLGGDILVAALIIAEQCLGACRDPFDRPAYPARGPQYNRLLRIDIALHAKAAADVSRDDADAAFRDVEYLVRKDLANTVHVLRAAVERPATSAGIPVANAA